MLYVGTDRGVVFSRDDGATWQPLMLNLPTVPVEDLRVKNGDLVLATHGRSIWILDDLTSVREMTPSIAAQPLHAFAPRPPFVGSIGVSRERAREPLTEPRSTSGSRKPKELTLEIRDARRAGTQALEQKRAGLPRTIPTRPMTSPRRR
jgi:hypothetical protein